MTKKRILILIIIIILSLIVIFGLNKVYEKYGKRIIKQGAKEELLPMIEHIDQFPEGGGRIIYGQIDPQNLMSEKQILQKVIPSNTFVDHVSDFPEAGGTGIYPPVPEVPTGPIIPPSTFIKHIDEE